MIVSDFPCYHETEETGSASMYQGSHDCPEKSVCSYWPSGPAEGIVSFDNFIKASVTVFQLITLEGWSGVYYLVRGLSKVLLGVFIFMHAPAKCWDYLYVCSPLGVR